MARRHARQLELGVEAFGNGAKPPQTSNTTKPPGPFRLTPIFNAAVLPKDAKKVPVSKNQIKDLEKQRSQPVNTLEMTITGNVKGSYDPKRDRNIGLEIKAIEKKLAANRDVARKAFAKAQLRNKSKHAFNQTTRRKI